MADDPNPDWRLLAPHRPLSPGDDAKRGVAWPDDSDLSEAIADQQDSFRRALLPGDTQAIKAVEGTDGRELDLERRVRLLAQGILLERVREGRVWLQVHPLVVHAIRNRS